MNKTKVFYVIERWPAEYYHYLCLNHTYSTTNDVSDSPRFPSPESAKVYAIERRLEGKIVKVSITTEFVSNIQW